MVINKLIYPIFLKCCKFSRDNFWKFILEDLAYGNCPYGTYIVKNYLCCNYKGKEFSYKIDSKKDPNIIYLEIYDILHNKFGLLSNKDKTQNRKLFFMKGGESDIKEPFKKKYMKLILIEEFVENATKKYNLSFEQMLELYSIILTGFSLKSININSVITINNKIEKIDGIVFTKGNVAYNLNIYKQVTAPSLIIKDNNFLSDYWVKYLSKIKNLLE